MKKFIFRLLALALSISFLGTASATVLTFDDTSYQGTNYTTNIDAGYGGFTWSNNFGVYGTGVSNGYSAGIVSGSHAAFNAYGDNISLSDGIFDWTGAWFNDPHDATLLNVTGLFNGSVIYTANIQLTYGQAAWFQADWLNIDTLAFNTGGNDWFTMDDFTFNESAPVPEPATMLLFGFGLLGLAGVNRKKQK